MNVLFVCTANRARSPMAETIARTLLGGSAAANVASAGTRACDGDAMTAEAEAALHRHNYEVAAGFRSRLLTRPLIGGADLILTMETKHRAAVLALEPGALRRTFTLREFARLIPASSVPGRHLVEIATALRGAVPMPPPGADDIPDPMGYGDPGHDNCLALVQAALVPWMALGQPAI